MESKRDIRQRVLSKRNSMNDKEWEEKSRRIYEKVVTHPFFLESDEIFCYVDYRKEVETRNIIEYAWKLNKKIAVPKIEGDSMHFYYIHAFSELQEGYKGIHEPLPVNLATPNDNTLILMPGAVFDKDRHRIGYGKGFYDKYLSINQNCKTVALAFELQFVEQILTDKYDICPQIIITEEDIYE